MLSSSAGDPYKATELDTLADTKIKHSSFLMCPALQIMEKSARPLINHYKEERIPTQKLTWNSQPNFKKN
jgi:hypothetical protein